jgi:glycosyltransferase involved in cell wall biosynthesis
MKVAMLGWEFPPFISGGLGVHCWHLAKNICGLGVKIDFFMPASGQKIASPHPNIKIYEVSKAIIAPYFSAGMSLSPAYFLDLPRALWQYNSFCAELVSALHAQEKYSLLHAHDWLTFHAAKKLKTSLSLPLVHTVHSTEFDRNPIPWDFIINIERQLVQNADRLITVSNRMKRQLQERLGADEKKIRVVYNAVEAEEFESRKHAKACILLPLLREKKKVLFLGRLTGQKAPAEFLHAARKVLRFEPNTAFLVAGTGDMLPYLINLSLELGIQDKVFFLGHIPDEERKKIYAQCDVYVMPSVSEPFGISALEAMASGTPTIISKEAGVGEVAKSLLRVDFWDTEAMAQKIVALLRYQPLAKTMSSLSYNEARKFSWEDAARETLNVYHELL